MAASTAVWLLFLLLTKHFVVDFLLQPKWMWENKGKLGHPGGLAHAGLHAVVTAVILEAFMEHPVAAMVLATSEGVAHYGIDYMKVNINALMDWAPATSEKFWWLLGLDQWLHNCCYVVFVFMLVGANS